ncbi:MAG: hypothetical protein PHS14_00210 [Elusimicrobia bacterium]|nr:hypothetical protein [Elusimicrobiota bacterium]
MPPATAALPVPQAKWLRQFWMQVQGATRLWTITSPLTLELDVERAIFQSVSRFTFKVYNLGVQARSDLYLDQNNWLATPRPIIVNAGYASWQSGYGPQTPQAFPTIARGQLFQAYSTRVGPSWVTTMTGWDGGYDQANAYINVPFSKGVTFNQRVTQIAKSMANLRAVYISPRITANVSRGAAYSGKPWDILCELANYAQADVFIDLGVLYMVPKGQAVPGLTAGLNHVSTQYGLLNTPIKQQFRVAFDMVFEPRLLVGQNLSLVSEEPENNGSYVLQGLSHRGIISDGVEGDCTTTPTLWNPATPTTPQGGT